MNSIAILGLVIATSSPAPESVVLRDPAHKNGLIYERKVENGITTITETWSLALFSRFVKSVYSETGALTERDVTSSNRMTASGSPTRSDAQITPSGATVTVLTRTRPLKPTTIPLQNSRSIVDPSVKWFSGVVPEKGTSVAFMNFEPEYRYWEEVTVTFDGKGKLGASPEGYLVTRKAARKTIHLLLDDRGLPLVWEEKGLRLVREPH